MIHDGEGRAQERCTCRRASGQETRDDAATYPGFVGARCLSSIMGRRGWREWDVLFARQVKATINPAD